MLLVHLCGIAKRKKEPILAPFLYLTDILFQSECRVGNTLPFIEDVDMVKAFCKVFS